ncbi:FMN-binding protein [bacterium]|nr:FMN-binding protein [bacterium]
MARASAGTGDAAAEPAAYADGTYTGTGMGMDGRITVTLQVKNGRVACVRIEQDGETQSVGGFEAIRDSVYAALIDKAQGSAIDNVAGATITTAGVRMAVDDALAQATGAAGAKASPATRAASSLAEGTRPAASSSSDASAAADAAKA